MLVALSKGGVAATGISGTEKSGLLKSKICTERRQVSPGIVWTIGGTYIGEITHVFPAPVIYFLGKDILALGLLEPSLQEKDIADVVTFFGKDVASTGKGRYHVARNSVAGSRKGIFESELFRYR